MITLKLDENAIKKVLEGDDGTIKVELQNAVIENFSKRYIKELCNTEMAKKLNTDFETMIKEYTEDIERSIRAYLKSIEITLNPTGHRINVTEYVKEQIKKQINESFTSIVDECIRAQVQELIYNDVKIKYDFECEIRKQLIEIEKENETRMKKLVDFVKDNIPDDKSKAQLAKALIDSIGETK